MRGIEVSACAFLTRFLLLAFCTSVAVHAQTYPSKPLRIIVTSTPSSGPDIIARLIGQKLTEAWGQQVVVDARAGASGTIGAEIAARSAPDGYTLVIGTSQWAIVAAMFSKLPYSMTRDFSPVSLIASTPFILVVNPAVPATSVPQLIALLKSKPGELRYGSGGSGSPPHLAAEIFRSMTATEMMHVPYKGVTPALVDTLGGQVQLTFAVIPAVLSMVKSGKVRALAVTSAKRTALVPDLPAIAEFVPGYEFIGWYGMLAPAKTPEAVLSRLNAEVVKALKTPELQERLAGLGAEPIGSTRAELAAFISVQLQKMRKAVETSGAHVE
jgi:tripartite-type tricarboxylate transporter receptor subunit TctC